MTVTYAPGKLILSGEHAVVYGHPALAMAVNRYVKTTISKTSKAQILFDLVDLAQQKQLTLPALSRVKNKIKRKYQQFVQGELGIRDVLQKPAELAQFALGLFAETYQHLSSQGLKVKVQSDIPIGCGMGSSAASILSMLKAVANYSNVAITNDVLLEMALQAENMQHGYSSGLDLKVILEGGALYLHGDHIEKQNFQTNSFYFINTGTPLATTGQCVEKVAPLFKNIALGDEFAAVTNALTLALQQEAAEDACFAVRKNHELLVHIGVVPEPVQQFIHAIQVAGGAAKICGAGSITGEQAGMVLVMLQDEQRLASICQRFAYELTSIKCESRGLYAN